MTWEYKRLRDVYKRLDDNKMYEMVVTSTIEDQANELSHEGWRLVFVHTAEMGARVGTMERNIDHYGDWRAQQSPPPTQSTGFDDISYMKKETKNEQDII
jgi:hypothetical protein